MGLLAAAGLAAGATAIIAFPTSAPARGIPCKAGSGIGWDYEMCHGWAEVDSRHHGGWTSLLTCTQSGGAMTCTLAAKEVEPPAYIGGDDPRPDMERTFRKRGCSFRDGDPITVVCGSASTEPPAPPHTRPTTWRIPRPL